MGSARLQAWAASLLVLACAAVPAARAEPTAGQTFEHPSRHYTVTIPADARIREPGGTVDIAIDSDKGYGVILQSADIGPGASISEMAATLEAAYLGPDKAWNRKVRQEVTLVAGLVSYNGHYEGEGGASYRVVITRGQINSYTFIFRARTPFFPQMEPEFDWILANFKPAPGDLPPMPIPPGQAKPVAPVGEQAAGPMPATRRFAERHLGYAVDYDAGWIVERPSAEAVMLSGPEGTDAFFATVSFQNVAPPEAKTAVQAASMAMDDILAQFEKQATDVVFERRGPYIYSKNDMLLLGQEFVVAYVQAEQRYRQWTLVVPRPESDGAVAHIWSYRAPVDRFDRFRPAAEAILQSWTIVKRETTNR